MSEDHAFFSGPLPQPVRQAQVFMERRGQQLSATALRVLAREVILRFSRVESSVVRASIRPATSELDALCDALIQSPEHRADVERHVVRPLQAKLAAAQAEQVAETAATRVDFYTLVRGEN